MSRTTNIIRKFSVVPPYNVGAALRQGGLSITRLPLDPITEYRPNETLTLLKPTNLTKKYKRGNRTQPFIIPLSILKQYPKRYTTKPPRPRRPRPKSAPVSYSPRKRSTPPVRSPFNPSPIIVSSNYPLDINNLLKQLRV
jgi:hypothetical protein